MWLPSHEARQRDRAVNDTIRRKLAFDAYARRALERASQGKKAPSLSHALDVVPKAFVPALALKFGVWDSMLLSRVQLAVAECIVTKKWAADLTSDELLERVRSSGMMQRARAQQRL